MPGTKGKYQKRVSRESSIVKEDTEDRRERQALAGIEGRHDALMNKTVEERLVI